MTNDMKALYGKVKLGLKICATEPLCDGCPYKMIEPHKCQNELIWDVYTVFAAPDAKNAGEMPAGVENPKLGE